MFSKLSKPRNFQELVTRAHDMELTIASRRDSSLSFADTKGTWLKSRRMSSS